MAGSVYSMCRVNAGAVYRQAVYSAAQSYIHAGISTHVVSD